MSIKKLAEHLKLSKSTVSRALNGYADVSAQTREKVMQGAKEINYRPNATAKRLASGKSRHIGIILPSNEGMFISPAFSKVLASASNLLAKHDYLLIVTTIAPFQDEIKVYQDFMNGGLVDGLFVVRTRKDDERIALLNSRNFPYICHGHLPGFTPEMFVDVDNEQAFYDMTKKQITAGHQRIAFLDGPSELALSQSRLTGYRRAMAEHQLAVHESWIQNGQISETDAATMAKEVLSLAQRPTAIICADDLMALGAISASESLGFTPGDDLAVAGYGDYNIGRYSKPPITSMAYNNEKVGEEMAKLMLNKLEATTFDVQNWYRAHLIQRQSDQMLE